MVEEVQQLVGRKCISDQLFIWYWRWRWSGSAKQPCVLTYIYTLLMHYTADALHNTDQWLKWTIRGGRTVHSNMDPLFAVVGPSLQSGPPSYVR